MATSTQNQSHVTVLHVQWLGLKLVLLFVGTARKTLGSGTQCPIRVVEDDFLLIKWERGREGGRESARARACETGTTGETKIERARACETGAEGGTGTARGHARQNETQT